jgi:type IV pilus assembly protein PilC
MQFSYKAKDSGGKIKYGKLNARNKSELADSLRHSGLTLISSKKENKGAKEEKETRIKLPQFLKRVSVVDKMLFTHHLKVMLKAGLSFSRALAVLSEQTNNKYFKEVIQLIREDANRGVSLADSLAKHPHIFDELFVSMIRVGETGGNLEEVLDILAIQLKKEHELVSKVKGAMMYPAVILIAMIIIGVLMMIFVVPSLLKMFEEMDTELPATTQMIIFVSNTLQNHGIFVLLGFIISGGLFFKTIKTARGEKAFDCFLLRLPIVGNIVSKVNMARFSRTLSSMIASGVSIVRALEIISNTLGNVYYRDSVKKASEDVQKGVVLSEVLGRYKKLYQPLMINMIEVGEETGTLEDTLKQVAEFYEGEVEQITSNLSSVIEPVLMLIMGGAVGLFAMSIIQPMYSIMGSI